MSAFDLISSLTLEKLLNFSELQLPFLYNKDIYICLTVLRIK